MAEEPETVLMRLGDDRHDSNGDPDAMIGARVGPFTLVRLLGEGSTGRLCHRNVIQVHDVGQLPSGEWFMVLDERSW